jgi:hypothetical protein
VIKERMGNKKDGFNKPPGIGSPLQAFLDGSVDIVNSAESNGLEPKSQQASTPASSQHDSTVLKLQGKTFEL